MSIATLSALEQADFTVEQARTLTRVLEEDHHNLATKEETQSIRGDIKDIRGEVKSLETKMEAMEIKLESKIESIASNMDTLATKDELNKMAMVTKDYIESFRIATIKWIFGAIVLSGFLQMLLNTDVTK